jgi:hypothetical protein
VPEEVVDEEIEALRASVAELTPVEGRRCAPATSSVIDVLDEDR